jgi:UDP-N-acetylmuramoylalanine--D-glutamate ligase
MVHTDYYSGKRITIVGLARSGLASALLFDSLGASVKVTDSNDVPMTRTNAQRLSGTSVAIELGSHSEGFIRGSDCVIISPGVPDTALPVVWAKALGIPVFSEVEAVWKLCPAPVIAITGTNGKTTVTTLIGKVLRASGKNAIVCGNIGNPFAGEIQAVKPSDYVVLEISSFQLEHIEAFKPKVAVILNVSRNHLDRYASMEEYLAAKKRIFMNQDREDYLVLNALDPLLQDSAREACSRVVYFTKEEGLNPNQSAVLAVTALLGIEKQIALEVFKVFTGVEHRLEIVSDVDGIKFINDSKATTVDATLWALRTVDAPVILIVGGREKGNDYSAIVNAVREKVKHMVVIGETKEKIRRSFQDIVPLEEASSLEEAVEKARQQASRGDCILFSPMCKSFDMFTDYEDRGRKFKSIVVGIREQKV